VIAFGLWPPMKYFWGAGHLGADTWELKRLLLDGRSDTLTLD
jgi:hypothetical protein